MRYTFVSILLLLTFVATTSSAQVVLDDSGMAAIPRLTVRPHQMATGTRNEKAGITRIPGLPDYFIDVPPQAVGTERVPLVVLVHGGGLTSQIMIDKFLKVMDKYKCVILMPNAIDTGAWEMVYGGIAHCTKSETGLKVSKLPMKDVMNIDSSMKFVLRNYAIDPNRVALMGFSDGGSSTFLLGRSNLDIFDRVMPLSGLVPFDGTGPANPTTQFYVSGGVAEDMVWRTMKMAQVLRKEGHPTVTLLALRGHVDRAMEEEFVWKWLFDSWRDPSITTHMPIQPDAVDPLLTVEAMHKMTDFWTRFKQEQTDSILKAGRIAHQKETWVWLGKESTSVISTDMPALAAAYPRVATDLKAAGLTAEQEDALRMAIVRVGFARAAAIAPGDTLEPPRRGMIILGQSIPYAPIEPSSKLGKNLAFRKAHDAEFKALEATDMWTIQ